MARRADSKNASLGDDLDSGLYSILSRNVFPGRKTLYVFEVAKVLSISERHVVHLINEGSIGAVELPGRGKSKNSIARWTIPVSAYDDFLRKRSSRSRQA